MAFAFVLVRSLSFGAHATCAVKAQLTGQEIAQCTGYTTNQQHKRLCGRYLSRKLVAEATRCALHQVQIAHEKGRAPQVLGPKRLNLSLTYSDTHAVAVVSAAPVGIDAETIRPLDDLDTLIEAMCHSSERKWLDALSPEARLKVFYKIWTSKEAVLKALGEGLSIEPCRIALCGQTGTMSFDGCETDWTAQFLSESGGDVVCIAKL